MICIIMNVNLKIIKSKIFTDLIHSNDLELPIQIRILDLTSTHYSTHRFR